MDSWKTDLQTINRITRGQTGETWKRDIMSVAGGNPHNWKQAFITWAAAHGVAASTWREAVIGVSMKLVAVPPKTWVEALKYIRMYYEGNPPELLKFTTADGLDFVTADNRPFMVLG